MKSGHEMAYKRLFEVFNNPNSTEPETTQVYGTVISVSPLSVRREDGINIPASMLILASHLESQPSTKSTTFDVKLSSEVGADEVIKTTWTAEEGEFAFVEITEESEGNGGIAVGNKVVMFAFNGGQKFYIAEVY